MTLNSLIARKAKRIHNPGEQGQGLVEYALILVLVAVVVIVILALMGPAVSNVYCTVVLTLNPSGTCEGGSSLREFNTLGELQTACANEGTEVPPAMALPDDLAAQGIGHLHACASTSNPSNILWHGYHTGG